MGLFAVPVSDYGVGEENCGCSVAQLTAPHKRRDSGSEYHTHSLVTHIKDSPQLQPTL